MTTRSKKQGAQATATAVDPQNFSQPSSSGTNNNQAISAESTIDIPGATSSKIDMIDSQNIGTTEIHATSPLTSTGSPHLDPMDQHNKTPTMVDRSELPGAFSSTESRRRRVLEKAPVVEPTWRTVRGAPENITPPLMTVGSKSTDNNAGLIPIPDEYNVGSELEIAEFESNRASSPEDNDHGDQIIELDVRNEMDEANHSNPGDEDRNSRSSNNEFDKAILSNDQLAYDLAHDNNGPWTDLAEDERSAQLFLNELSDHQHVVIRVLAHRQVGLLFKHLGIEEIDPDSDIYQEQYNLVVTTMVGGRIVIGGDVDRGDEGHRNASVDDQLHDPFDFQAGPKHRISPTEKMSNHTSVKEEEITPPLGIPTDPPRNSEEQLPVTDEPSPKRAEDIDGGRQHHSGLSPRYGQTIKDKVILQRWRAHDLADNGQTEIADQGIFIDDEGNAFIMRGGIADTSQNKEQKKSPNPPNPGAPKQSAPRAASTATRAANIPSGGPPDGGPPNGGRNDGASRWGSRLPIPIRGLGRGRGGPPRLQHVPPPGPPGGGGPPLGDGSQGGDDPGGSEDDDDGQSQHQIGYYMPPNEAIARGITQVTDRSHNRVDHNARALNDHRRQMHDRIERYIDEHLHVHLHLPDGVKAPRLDTKNISSYTGSSSVSEFWTWLKSLVIYLETSQLGGLDRDRERKLLIEPVLTGAAKKWYHDHVIEVDEYANWTFISVIIGLYDRFIHDSAMQEA
ncbi:hypothetical protein IW262DRAFT_1467237 [Armillaria fumosa]|nr:hypothetical protein IW262DRAFT_1467237 [Armillaria fumosa]